MRSRPAHSAASDLSNGISRRQGAHQVAQKLITSDLPRQAEIGVDLPVRSCSEKSGKRAGTTGCGMAASDAELSEGWGALATPAGTNTPRSGVPRTKCALIPTQIPSNTTNAAPNKRSPGVFMPERRVYDSSSRPARPAE